MDKRSLQGLRAFAFASLVLFSVQTFAQLLQPTEYIDASSSNAFQERVGIWPSMHLSNEDISVQDVGLSEGLNRIPGLEAREQGSPGIFMRGSSSAGRVQEVWNGINLSSGSGLGPDALLIPTENLYDLTLLKGPSATFQGRDAMGGALWFRSRQLESATVRGQLGSFGQRSIFIGAPLTPRSENHHAQITVFNDRSDGNFDYQLPRINTSGTRQRNDTNIDRYTFESEHKIGSWEIQPKAIWARQLGSTPGSVTSQFPADVSSTSWMGSLSVGQPSKTGFGWSARPSYIDSRNSNNSVPYSNRSHRFVQSIALTEQIGPNFHAHVFSDLNWDGYDVGSSANYYRQGQDYGVVLLFPIEDDWVFQPSARYLAQLGQWVGAYVIEKPIQDYRIHANFSEGVREPGLSDLFEQDSFFIGNPGLQPERSQQIEVGFVRPWKHASTFWQSFEYGFNVYQVRYMNLIQYNAVNANASTPINAGAGNVSGFEFNALHNWDVWTATLGYVMTQSQIPSTNQPILHTPEYQLSAELGYQFGPVIFSVRDTQWGRQFDQAPGTTVQTELGAWNSLDFLIKTAALSKWTFRAGALNILNTPHELTLGYPEPQLRFFANLERRL